MYEWIFVIYESWLTIDYICVFKREERVSVCAILSLNRSFEFAFKSDDGTSVLASKNVAATSLAFSTALPLCKHKGMLITSIVSRKFSCLEWFVKLFSISFAVAIVGLLDKSWDQQSSKMEIHFFWVRPLGHRKTRIRYCVFSLSQR